MHDRFRWMRWLSSSVPLLMQLLDMVTVSNEDLAIGMTFQLTTVS